MTRHRRREPDTWEIRNAGSLPVLILAATVVSPATSSEEPNRFEVIDLPPGGSPEGVVLAYDDEVTEIRRQDWQEPWSGRVVEAGDTLRATVPTNTSLVISYRRAGVGGVLERRQLKVHGGA